MPKQNKNQAQSDTAQLLRNILAEELAPIRKELAEIKRELQTVTAHITAGAAPEEKELPESPFARDRQAKHVAKFFLERGYLITKCLTQNNSGATEAKLENTDDGGKIRWISIGNNVTYKLAKNLWGCIEIARPLLNRLYKEHETFSYPVNGLSPDEKNRLGNLCRRMAAESWLKFRTMGEAFEITPAIPKQYRNFLNGGWAEAVNRYLIYKTLTEYSKHDLKYKVLWNVCLRRIDSERQNGHDMELDIVVDLTDRIYVFETKSGKVLGVDKWIKRADMFNGPNSRFILCCLDDTVDPKWFSPYELFALPKLEKQFSDLLRKDFDCASGGGEADKASPTGL